MADLPMSVERWRKLVQFYFRPEHWEYALRMIDWESGGDPMAENPKSSARGLFQHLERLWPDRIARVTAFYGDVGITVSEDIFDPEANIAAAAWLLDQAGRHPVWGGWGQWTPSHTKPPTDFGAPQFGDPSIPFPKGGYTGSVGRGNGKLAGRTAKKVRPPTLKFGDSGEDVKTVQRILRSLGLFDGSIGGNFRTLTEKAVIAFQRTHRNKNGKPLRASGKVTQSTWWALRHLEESVTDPMLKFGDSGDDVKVLQRLLQAAGTFAGSVRGNFRTLTQGALDEFQVGHQGPDGGPLTSGVADAATWWALRNQVISVAREPTLSYGDKGAWVKVVQQLLKEQGFFKGSVRGNFLKLTRDAVLYFQHTHLGPIGEFLESDGIVGPDTWWALRNPVGRPQASNLSRKIPRGLTPKRLEALMIALDEHKAGVKEDPNGSNAGDGVTKYLPGGKGAYWCCYFWSWVNRKTFPTYSLGARYGRVSSAFAKARELGLARQKGSYIPIPGDAFIMATSKAEAGRFEFTGTGHIGFVLRVEVAGNRAVAINTVEGNSGNRVKLGRRSLSDPAIVGYINNYDADEQPTAWQRGLVTAADTAGATTR